MKINYLCKKLSTTVKILVTNDDGYEARGLKVLVGIVRSMGDLTVIAPKYPQSAMSTAVTMGGKTIAVKQISNDPKESWWYMDATPASCVKFALDEIFWPKKPDILFSGINHGANAASAELYSATLGAAEEGALAGIPSFGISLDSYDVGADMGAIEKYLPGIIRKILKHKSKKRGLFYNINFPALPADKIKGIRVCHQGVNHWEREFKRVDPEPDAEEGEKFYVIVGDIVDNKENIEPADHHYLGCGYITIVADNIDATDYEENGRLRDLEMDCNF